MTNADIIAGAEGPIGNDTKAVVAAIGVLGTPTAPLPVETATGRTPNFAAVGASASGNIPAGAKSWCFVLLTGTGTIGGVAAPLGVPINGNGLLALLAYATGATSSAFVAYET